MIYVLYHSSCYDGFGAAFAAWKKFGNSAKYLSVSYGKPMPAIANATELYIVDFSYDEETLIGIADTGVKVVVLDHHKSAKEKLEKLVGRKNPEVIFDMKRSGAGITWDYFHGVGTRPQMINLIEDRDLWRFKYGDSTKQLHSYLLSQPFEFSIYDRLLSDLHLDNAISEGAALLRMTDQIVEKICKNARVYDNFFGHRAVVVNTSSHWSEVGNRLLELYPDVDFAASYTDLPEETRMFSLRSKAPFDVARVAEMFGGGGHAQAAGFKAKLKIPFNDIQYIKEQK